MELYQKLINEVIAIEGGYVNDPKDSGGETKYGITKTTARNSGYYGSMRDLTKTTARAIYKKLYWDSLKLTAISGIARNTAAELFDTGVNLGTGRAGRFLQRALNVFNPKAKLIVDGAVGPATLSALSKFIRKRGADGDIVLTRALNSLQGSFYINLAERREKDKRFVYGWFLHRVG